MGVAQDTPGFGVQLEKLKFKDDWDWFIAVRDPREAFLTQPTYLLSEYLFYAIALLTLIHSFIVGGRWKYLWLGTVIHGLTTELVSFALPDIDNYWHSQTTVMLLGRRLPLHIPLIYPSFMYTAAYVVSHMKLPKWSQPLAAGLTEVLMDIPYDIMAVKFVHWTWHDTDPNIFDRHYWVPWNSYYFHLTFGLSFNFFLNFWRKKLTGNDTDNKTGSCFKELLSAILGGLCGMPGGVLQFMLLYHPLHDIWGIHTENCVFLLVIFYFLIVWEADRKPSSAARRSSGDKTHWSAYIIALSIVLHYSLYLGMALVGNPEAEVSIGLHEKTGACDKMSDVQTAFGVVLKKRTFLCTKDFDEKYYDFHCLNKPPKDGVEWYTICGTKFENRAEYISILMGICLAAFFYYYNLLFRSSATVRTVKGAHSKPVQNKPTKDKKQKKS